MIAGVPYDAQIAYLQSDGNAYIDMGRPIGSGFWFETTLKIIGTNNQYKSILGARTGSGVEDYQFSFVTYGSQAQNRLLARYGTNSGQFFSKYPATEFLTVRVDSDCKLYFNGTLAATLGYASPSSQNLFLFALNDNGTASQNLGNLVRMYGIKYGDSSGQHDLIPVRVGTTGYLYDRVTRKLYGNAGTGSFTLGPDVATPVVGLRMFKPTARSYVQEGLVAMWDAIENAGWGVHDSNANYWKELVSDTNSQVLDSAFTWGDDFLSTQGGTRSSTALYPSDLLADRTPGTAYSLEVVYRDYVSGGVLRYLLSAAGNTAIRISSYMRNGLEQFDIKFNNAPYYIYKENSSAVAGSHNVTMTCDGVNTKVYIDGKYVAPNAGGGIGPQTPASGAAYFAWQNPSVHKEKYCRLSLHKYAMTAEQVAHNYAIDKARFGLPDPS